MGVRGQREDDWQNRRGTLKKSNRNRRVRQREVGWTEGGGGIGNMGGVKCGEKWMMA